MDVIDHKGLSQYVTGIFHNSKREITFPNGSTVIFDHCQDSGKSKGYANKKYVIIDEIDQFSLMDFIGTVSSFRGDEGIRFIFLFNPVSDRHWLKKVFFTEIGDDGSDLYIKNTNSFHYTIEDNKFATEMDYAILDGLKNIDINQYRIQRLGQWGTINVDNPFLDAFSYSDNVVEGDIPFFTNYPLCIGFDFGKTESCVVGQHFQDYDIESDIALSSYFEKGRNAITRIRSYRVGGSSSNVGVIVRQIVEEFGTNTEYYITGDTSGGSDSYSKFVEIAGEFESLGAFFLYFPKRIKPTHKTSRAVSNWCLRTYGKNFKISTNCDTYLDDIQQVRVDEYGNIDKQDCVRHDKGHCLDAGRYMDFTFEVRNFYLANKHYTDGYIERQITTLLEE
jgi:phage terminase large subunit